MAAGLAAFYNFQWLQWHPPDLAGGPALPRYLPFTFQAMPPAFWETRYYIKKPAAGQLVRGRALSNQHVHGLS